MAGEGLCFQDGKCGWQVNMANSKRPQFFPMWTSPWRVLESNPKASWSYSILCGLASEVALPPFSQNSIVSRQPCFTYTRACEHQEAGHLGGRIPQVVTVQCICFHT